MEFQRTKDNIVADELINNLNLTRRQRCRKITENLNFTHKAWSIMKKLGGSNQAKKRQHILRPNSVAARLLSMRIFSIDKEHKQIIKTELKSQRKILVPHPTQSITFTQN